MKEKEWSGARGQKGREGEGRGGKDGEREETGKGKEEREKGREGIPHHEILDPPLFSLTTCGTLS